MNGELRLFEKDPDPESKPEKDGHWTRIFSKQLLGYVISLLIGVAGTMFLRLEGKGAEEVANLKKAFENAEANSISRLSQRVGTMETGAETERFWVRAAIAENTAAVKALAAEQAVQNEKVARELGALTVAINRGVLK